jgi:L-threonylcarbamoyladenylate synthase
MNAPIDEAVRLLRAGKLVAFPTETVYGLGADATNADAVAKIFSTKGRPATNPLIVHVATKEIAQRYVLDWPDAAETLAHRFWPGPLTLILRKQPSIADNVTAGGGTVGIRVPDHPLALELLRAFDGPIAAPSANKANHTSPTTATHVRDELGDAVDLILDGGPCTVGIESTVLDLTTPTPRILRPGRVNSAMIESILNTQVGYAADFSVPKPTIEKSPGNLPVHYAPRTPAFHFQAADQWRIDPHDAAVLPISLDPEAYARQLYARLRMLDQQGLRAIYIELPPDVEAWRAVRDRILRATRPLPALPPT